LIDLAQVTFDLIDQFHVRSEKVSIIDKLEAVGTWKYRLLLPVKLRISELNAWNK